MVHKKISGLISRISLFCTQKIYTRLARLHMHIISIIPRILSLCVIMSMFMPAIGRL